MGGRPRMHWVVVGVSALSLHSLSLCPSATVSIHSVLSEIVPIFRSLEKCIFSVKSAADRAVRGFDGLQTISRKADDAQYAVSRLFVEAAQRAGYRYNDDYNGVSQDGVSFTQYNIDADGRRLSSFRAFVATLFCGHNDKESAFDIDIVADSHVVCPDDARCALCSVPFDDDGD